MIPQGRFLIFGAYVVGFQSRIERRENSFAKHLVTVEQSVAVVMDCETLHNRSNSCIGASPTEAETISFIVVVCIGIIGCFVAVLALGREFFVGKTSTLVIVAALTWVDFTGVLSTGSFVFHGLAVGNGWIGGYPQCEIQAFCTTACCVASGSVVTFMAIDRTVSLYKPFFYKTAASPSLARAICVAIVTICLLVSSFPFMGIGNYILSQSGSYVCHVDIYSSNPERRTFILILGLIAAVVITMMLTSNVVVFYLVWKLKKNVCRIFPSELSRNKRAKNKCIAAKKEQQMAQFVALVSLIFLITWLPLTVRLFCNYFQVSLHETLDLVAMKIAVSGFIVNPFSYVLFRSIFKRTLKRSFSQMQTGIGNKIFIKSQSNRVFHIKVKSRIHRGNSTVEPSKFITDIFDPNFTHIRSKTLETII